MKPNLSNLVNACVEAHIKSSTTLDAKRQFNSLIQLAYDLGVNDAKEESQSEKSESNSKSSNKESYTEKRRNALFRETTKESSQKEESKEETKTERNDVSVLEANEALRNF